MVPWKSSLNKSKEASPDYSFTAEWFPTSEKYIRVPGAAQNLALFLPQNPSFLPFPTGHGGHPDGWGCWQCWGVPKQAKATPTEMHNSHLLMRWWWLRWAGHPPPPAILLIVSVKIWNKSYISIFHQNYCKYSGRKCHFCCCCCCCCWLNLFPRNNSMLKLNMVSLLATLLLNSELKKSSHLDDPTFM